MTQRFIEGHAEQVRECSVALFIVRFHFDKHILVVVTGVLITIPRIDSVTIRSQAGFNHGLTKRKIRIRRMRSELDEHAGRNLPDHPCSEGHVTDPGGRAAVSLARTEATSMRVSRFMSSLSVNAVYPSRSGRETLALATQLGHHRRWQSSSGYAGHVGGSHAHLFPRAASRAGAYRSHEGTWRHTATAPADSRPTEGSTQSTVTAGSRPEHELDGPPVLQGRSLRHTVNGARTTR